MIERGIRDASPASQERAPHFALKAALQVNADALLPIELLQDTELFIIGRNSESCNATVSDPRVSRRHAAIGVLDGVAFIEDLDSTNGTFVNGVQRRQRHPLADGDTIRVGRTEAVFRQSIQPD